MLMCLVRRFSLVALIAVAAPAGAAPHNAAPPLPPPAGPVINVSTERQLQDAVNGASAGTTVVIAPGSYTLTSTLYVRVNDITIKGATNNRNDVVLIGRGMTNTNYGPVMFGVWTDAQRLTIANLTIRDVYEHAVMLNPGAESPWVYNVRMLDIGSQFIKASPASGGGVDQGRVEYSAMEYTTTSRDYYTNGVDVHTGVGWTVRHNLFRNIRAPQGELAGPAVLFWNGSRDTVVEGNTFINCQREISLGLVQRSPDDHTGGVVRNNFLVRAAGMSADAAILIADSPNTRVVHNTVLTSGTYPNAIEYRFANTTGTTIANNLLDARVSARDGATGSVSSNYTAASAGMFANPSAGDLHLKSSATAVIDRVAAHSIATTDWDGQPRPQGGAADYGADEYVSTTPPPPNSPPTVSLTSPASGSAFTAPATIAMSATAADADGSIAGVDFYSGSTHLGTDTTYPYTFSWVNVAAGSYSLRAVARDNLNASTWSATAGVTVTTLATGLPSPWSTRDIGSPAIAGSATYSSGTFTLKGAGSDIWGPSDQFRFVYRTLAGDGQITARVGSVQNTHGWAKAAVMIRETLTGSSKHAIVAATPANGISFQYRSSTGGVSYLGGGLTGAAPYWVRLVRQGSTMTAYSSSNGSTWTRIGSVTISMSSNVYIGLALTSHNASALTTATFSNVGVTSTVASSSTRLVFTASADHATNVNGYVMEVFTAGSNPSIAAPLLREDLGKPAVSNGEITADIATAVQNLAPGGYFATVSAIGPGGTTRSSPSNTFVR